MAFVSERAATLRPTAVNAILGEVSEARAQGRDIVSLMRGEPDFPTPAHIVEAAARAMRDGRTRYPNNRGEPALRDAVARQTHYDPEAEILITTGATLGLNAALGAILNDGDEVLLPDPVYDVYQSQIRLFGGWPRPVPGTVRDGRFTLDVDALEGAWTPAAKALLVNTPWNPTGTVFREAELRAVAEFAEKRDLVLISDEIYEAITYEPHRHVSPAGLDPAIRARTIVVNSLSKTYAMTGWRVGYCAGPRELIRTMYLVLQQSSRGPATFVQDAATAALDGPQDCVAAMLAEYTRRRSLVLDRLEDIDGVRPLPPEGGFFAMLDARGRGISSNDLRARLLREHGVVVVHGAAYGPAAEGTLRVSFAAGGDALDKGLERLREGLLT